jgi:GcrA cell cycle regulator
MEWTDETIARIRELWAEGHSTAEIGRRMGVSKNAIVGKAHRLNLEARPSPIRREGDALSPRPATARRFVGPTLPPLAAGLPPAETPQAAPVADPVAPPAEAPRPVAVRPLPPLHTPRTHTCCWPLGDPGTPSFRFCDAAATPGKPYCGEHAAMAYVRVRDKREDAAA